MPFSVGSQPSPSEDEKQNATYADLVKQWKTSFSCCSEKIAAEEVKDDLKNLQAVFDTLLDFHDSFRDTTGGYVKKLQRQLEQKNSVTSLPDDIIQQVEDSSHDNKALLEIFRKMAVNEMILSDDFVFRSISPSDLPFDPKIMIGKLPSEWVPSNKNDQKAGLKLPPEVTSRAFRTPRRSYNDREYNSNTSSLSTTKPSTESPKPHAMSPTMRVSSNQRERNLDKKAISPSAVDRAPEDNRGLTMRYSNTDRLKDCCTCNDSDSEELPLPVISRIIDSIERRSRRDVQTDEFRPTKTKKPGQNLASCRYPVDHCNCSDDSMCSKFPYLQGNKEDAYPRNEPRPPRSRSLGGKIVRPDEPEYCKICSCYMGINQ